MSKVDAKRALDIYKTFARQTDIVVQYLSTARQYQTQTRLEVPKLKHAPTTLGSSLEDYLNDPDFDVNRRQYLAQQEAKRTGRPVPTQAPQVKAAPRPTATASAPAPALAPMASELPTQPPRHVGADLIDFFESIEPAPQPAVQQAYPQEQQMNQGYAQPQAYQQSQQLQMMPQQSGYNPFMENFGQQPPPQPQPLQPDFTGAGFGGYGPQPHQPQTYGFGSPASQVAQNGMTGFSQQQQAYELPTQMQSPQALQPQLTSTNPFRQSTLSTGGGPGSPSPVGNINRQSTNPFAKHSMGGFQNQSIPENSIAPPAVDTSNQQVFQEQSFSPIQQQQQQQQPPQPLQAQRTGTNPFAKPTLSPSPAPSLPVNVTGSTNPFRQSSFVNQQTGQGWQHSQQGTFGGFDINGVQTTSIFPRPGAQQQT